MDLGGREQDQPVSAGVAIIRKFDASIQELIETKKQRWISLHQSPDSFTICGAWGEGEEEAEPFAIMMNLPPDWSYGQQIIHLGRLLTRPFVPLTGSRDSTEVARLYLRMALEMVKHYPWRGGRIGGTAVELSPRAVQVFNALQYIRQFLHLPLGRGSVARAIGVSESYLTALLKDCCDTNLTDYMLLERILRADGLLIRGNLPVAAIGELCGFSSTTYFIRAYRKIRKLTPLKIRQLAVAREHEDEWAERLFSFATFSLLKGLARPPDKAKLNHAEQRMLLIANATGETLDVEREQPLGDYAPFPSIGPMEIHLHWPPAPSNWRILKGGRVLHHYATSLAPCQILVVEEAPGAVAG